MLCGSSKRNSMPGQAGHRPEYFLTEPLPEIDADPDLLHRAFQNLVLNALDAMPPADADDAHLRA